MMRLRWLTCGAAFAAAACNHDGSSPPDAAAPPRTTVRFLASSNGKVDLLFMIDNSNTVRELGFETRRSFPALVDVLTSAAGAGQAVDVHIGVVTSDFGAGATGAPGCTPSGPSGGGDQGKLIGVGKKAMASCQKPEGANFVQYQFGMAPVHNLPSNQDLLETFACMASIGAQGCGFEHPLESVRAALATHIPENDGFLRDDAMLAVVFITDEDDASAPADSDIFDKNKVAQYGYEDSYNRQTRFAVMCGDPPAFPPYDSSHGPLLHCIPAPNPDGGGPGKQFDIRRYTTVFSASKTLGGLKANPDAVVLVAIDGPEEPFEVILSNPGTPVGQPYIPCARLAESSNPPCVPVLQPSCNFGPNRGADPAVRLNAVVRAASNHLIASVCDDDLAPAFRAAGRMMVDTLGAACLREALPRDPRGELIADCSVTAHSYADGQPSTPTPIPRCGASSQQPCWRVAATAACQGNSPDGVAVVIDWAAPPPANSTTVEASCIRKQ